MQKILIANRGEIAVRIIRTARELGYRTVAVFSEADADAPQTDLADEAVFIGPPAAAHSYLNQVAILEAAKCTGADALHPGYGFLAENAAFARAVEAAGLTFIGPPASAIELMGSKRRAKRHMQDAGVPCIPGFEGPSDQDGPLLEAAEAIGFPLMIKASAGGGGRGMRLVQSPRELAEQLGAARSEAGSAFGDPELILEKAVVDARHIEVQVFADTHGNTLHLGERDCSIQRRHQKVIEESPSPFVDEALRTRMGAAAVAAAQSCGYVGAGTVEFLVDQTGKFYFLEMNTRLQVEHPVTEMVTGQDLVEWQLRVAEGEALPAAPADLQISGHAIEARLYAEDPRRDCLPQTGIIHHFHTPERSGIRVDSGVREGQTIGTHYDPQLAKIIAWGPDRPTAVRRLASALEDTVLLGINSNRALLIACLRHQAFAAGEATTSFLDQHLTDHRCQTLAPPSPPLVALAALIFLHLGKTGGEPSWSLATPPDSFRLLACGEDHWEVGLTEKDSQTIVSVNDSEVVAECCVVQDGRVIVALDGVRRSWPYAIQNRTVFLDTGEGHFAIDDITDRPVATTDAMGRGEVHAPMAGQILEVAVTAGDGVTRGQTLLVLEAMKMEMQLRAERSGVVSRIDVAAGQQVQSGQLLATIDRGND